MRELIGHAAGICHGTGGRHFAWFARLLESRMDGICAHALHPVTSGKVEGANNRSRPSDANTTDYPTTNTSSSGSWTPAGKNNDGSPPPHPSTHKNPPRT